MQKETRSKAFFKTKQDAVILFCMLFAQSMTFMAMTMILPFFPIESEQRGINGLMIGIIYLASPLLQFLFSPIAGKSIHKIGAKFSLVSSCFLLAVSLIGFGFVGYLKSKKMFIVLSTLLRGLSGLANCIIDTCSATILIGTFSDNINTIISFQEISVTFGVSVGPVIGGGLYQIGGFFLPLAVASSITFIVMVVIFFISPKNPRISDNKSEEEEDKQEINQACPSIISFISIPGVSLHCSIIALTALSFSLLEVQLPNHLLNLTNNTITTGKIGFVMFLQSFGNALGSIVFSTLADKKMVRSDVMILVGLFSNAVLLYFLDSSPILDTPKPSILGTTIILFLENFVSATLLTLPVNMIRQHALENGCPDNIATDGITAGLFISSFNLGAMLGMPLGGYFKDLMPFGIACSILALSFFWETLVTALFGIYGTCSSNENYKNNKPMTNLL